MFSFYLLKRLNCGVHNIFPVTPSDTLIRRSISQQKTGVSITIDDPVRTARQPSPPRGQVSSIVHIWNLVRKHSCQIKTDTCSYFRKQIQSRFIPAGGDHGLLCQLPVCWKMSSFEKCEIRLFSTFKQEWGERGRTYILSFIVSYKRKKKGFWKIKSSFYGLSLDDDRRWFVTSQFKILQL